MINDCKRDCLTDIQAVFSSSQCLHIPNECPFFFFFLLVLIKAQKGVINQV